MHTILPTPSGRANGQRYKNGGTRKKLTTAHDIYQLIVGEIGIPRHEFLYEICFWEVRRIIRGYRRRNRLTHQLLAECAYASMFSMRDAKGLTAKDMFPGLFDNEPPPRPNPQEAEELIKEMQELIRNANTQQ